MCFYRQHLLGLCLPLLFCSYSVSAALSTTTANTIQGNNPILIESGINNLKNGINLAVKQKGGNNGSDEWEYNYSIAPGEANDVYLSLDTQFSNVVPSVLSNVLANNDIDDIDGDGLSDTRPYIISNFSYSWFDKNGTQIANTSTNLMGSDICITPSSYLGPFTLNITFDAVANTKYGDPYASDPVTIERSFKVHADDGICYAQPGVLSLNTQGGWPEGDDAWAAGRNSVMRDPAYNADVFVKSKGFKAWNAIKFPTLAFPEARFRIVPFKDYSNYDISIKNNPNNALIDQKQNQAGQFKFGDSKPSQTEPYTIEFKSKNNANISYFYSFKLKSSRSWFTLGTTQQGQTGTGQKYTTAVSDCGASNLPTRSEYTNSIYANATTWPPYEYAKNDGFMRDLGSLTAEWGHVYYYAPYTLNDKRDMMKTVTGNLKRYFGYWYYWTQELGSNKIDHYSVGIVEGNIGVNSLNESNGGILCVN